MKYYSNNKGALYFSSTLRRAISILSMAFGGYATSLGEAIQIIKTKRVTINGLFSITILCTFIIFNQWLIYIYDKRSRYQLISNPHYVESHFKNKNGLVISLIVIFIAFILPFATFMILT